MKKTKFGKTWRKRYSGEKVIEGEWCRRCNTNNCPYCGTGFYKKYDNRLRRREGRKAIAEFFE